MEQSTALKVLLIEDSQIDAELVLRALGGLARPVRSQRVSSEVSMRSALIGFEPDVILSDFSMPGFNGQQALQIAREVVPQVPFLFVSGTIGEELAIDALQRGAMDYVLKNNLRRLPSAVQRALDAASERQARERAEQALRESEERFRTLVETSRDWIWEIDAQLTMTYSNHAVEALLGMRPDEVVGMRSTDLLVPAERDEVASRIKDVLQPERRGWTSWRVRCRHRDGSTRIVDSSSTPILDPDGNVLGFRGVVRDITEPLRQEARIRQLARIRTVLGALGNSVLRVNDRAELMQAVCQVAVEQGGFMAAGIAVRGPGDTLVVTARAGDAAALQVVAPESALPIAAEGPYGRHPGIIAFREGRKVAIRDFADAGLPAEIRADMARVGVRSEIALPIGSQPWGLLALFSGTEQDYDEEEIALIERLASEIDYAAEFIDKSERLEYLAYYNPVTSLPNRSAFREEVQPLLERGPLFMAAVDIRRFGYINESRGRSFGDRLLRQVGHRLRAIAGAAVAFAHPEADTFLLAWSADAGVEEATARLEGWLEALEQQVFEFDGETLHVSLQAGLAHGPDHGQDPELLERSTLAALAEAVKRHARIHGFSEELRGRGSRRLALERDLRHAIEAEEFELYYQPKFNTATRALVGAEALLRWRRPDVGLVSPAEFIPVLEETGLIVPVGQWIMRSALATALEWRRHHPNFRVAVNVSARELRHTAFLDICEALLGPHGVDQPLDIEVTESLLMEDVSQSIVLLDGLRALGCQIAIDDFGTGYSSLNYLVRLPADEIKIDLSFVALLTHSPETMALVTNIINLAHSLRLRVVAEGVEEEEQAKLLRLLRCDVLQGYLLGRPMPAADFTRKLLAPYIGHAVT